MAAHTFTEDNLWQALAECFLPALQRDVVKAGLVRSASLIHDAEAPGAGIAGVPARYVARVILTAPGGEETVNSQARAAVENRLLGLSQVSRAEVTMMPALFPILKGR